MKIDIKCPECETFTKFSFTEEDIKNHKKFKCDTCGKVIFKPNEKFISGLNESVLDPVQKFRCDAMFNPNDPSETPVLLSSTKQFIISLLDKFKNEVGLPEMEYTEVFIIGSSLGFQYRDDCDIDVDVRVNLTKQQLKGKFHCIPKNVILPGTAHPVNIFVLTAEDPEYDFENDAENAYNVLTDTWIKQGRLANADAIPFEYIAGVSEFIMDGMTLELSRAERDLYDIDKYIKMDPNKVAISESERKEAISNKISQLIIDKDALRLSHTFMFRLDNDGFEDKPISISIKYKYEDKHFSMNNLLYKYIDRYGYYDKINEMVKVIDSTIATAKEELKKVVEDSPETRNTIEAQKEIADSVKNVDAEKVLARSEDSQQMSVTENYTVSDLKQILVENGFAPTLNNLNKILTEDYIIVEDLESRTERAINRKIYKASHNMHELVAQGIGFLVNGTIGMMVADGLWRENREEKDAKTRELYSYVDSDSECQDILSEIRAELKEENPDKAKIRELKNKFGKAVNRVKKDMKHEERNYNEMPKIKMKEE